MNLAARTLLTTAAASLILLPRLSYGADHEPHGYAGPWEAQYTTASLYDKDATRNGLLFTHKDSHNRKDAIAELCEENGTKGALAAGRYDFSRLSADFQAKGLLEADDFKDDDRLLGGHFRIGKNIAKGFRVRGKGGFERSRINSAPDGKNEDIDAGFGYGEIRSEDKDQDTREVRKSAELLAGAGHVYGTKSSRHSKERVNERPYGFQVIGTYGSFGAEAGITRVRDAKNSVTRNMGIFRFAGYGENKIPAGFIFYRTTPGKGTRITIGGLYWGPGIGGSWQLVEPAVNGMAQGMFTRTLAHPNRNISRLARFNDVQQFSRDNEDGTFVITAADFKQELGGGLEVGERELDCHYTLYKRLWLASNPHIGIASGETTEPYYNSLTQSMENATKGYWNLMASFNIFEEELERHGLRIGFFSNLRFEEDVHNTCGLYINGIRNPNLRRLF